MIKIIKEGTIKQLKCDTCGCLFQYEKEDIEKDEDTDLFLKCPQCKKII